MLGPHLDARGARLPSGPRRRSFPTGRELDGEVDVVVEGAHDHARRPGRRRRARAHAERPRARRRGRGRAAPPRPRRPARAPARAGPGVQGGHRERPRRRRRRRLHRRLRDAEHAPGQRHARRHRDARRARRARSAARACTRSAPSPSARRARRSPRWPTSRTPAPSRSRDDGRCVTSQRRHAPRARVRAARSTCRSSSTPRTTRSPRARRCTRAPSRTRLGLRGWPRVAEDIIVARDVHPRRVRRGARYHVAHVSTLGAVRIVREAKSRGIAVTAEVTPHHLAAHRRSRCIGYDTACKVNPPLREDEDVAALREALADGTIDCIATDHAPHSLAREGLRVQRGRARA